MDKSDQMVEIEVRADHITNGKCRSHAECMIALALLDADIGVPPSMVEEVYVMPDAAYFSIPGAECAPHISLPEHVTSLIRHFDRGESVLPFRFCVDASMIQSVAEYRRPHAQRNS